MPRFLQPTTLQEAWGQLSVTDDVRFLAGGTDLIVLLRQKSITCDALMDVKRLPELAGIRLTDESLQIGAAVTGNQILASELIGSEYTALKEAVASLANALLRNRATLAGNICNASPGGDLLAACLVLDASLLVASPRGERIIALKDFFIGVKRHVLERDEIVLRVLFPRTTGLSAYRKKKRIRGHDLAQVGVAGFYGADGHLRLALGAVATTPVLLDDFGSLTVVELVARREHLIDAAAAAARPITDVRASEEYRLNMVRLFTGRILDGFINGATEEEVV